MAGRSQKALRSGSGVVSDWSVATGRLTSVEGDGQHWSLCDFSKELALLCRDSRRPEQAEHEPCIVRKMRAHEESRVLITPTDFLKEFRPHALGSRFIRAEPLALFQEQNS
jgi:hypothetical protein